MQRWQRRHALTTSASSSLSSLSVSINLLVIGLDPRPILSLVALLYVHSLVTLVTLVDVRPLVFGCNSVEVSSCHKAAEATVVVVVPGAPVDAIAIAVRLCLLGGRSTFGQEKCKITMTNISSRLLGLPAEVWDYIWQYVVGEMTLHTGEWLTDEGARWGVNQRQRFIEDRNGNTLNDQAIQAGRTSQRYLNRLDEMPVSVTVCLAGTTDDEDARERHVGAAQYPTAFQGHRAAARLAASGRHEHSKCTHRTRGNRPNLGLLLVCRLIYREARFTSW
ncbi:hypothetical protein LTR17_011965 [Elasticomyces elasticus]|nr:hypothetical protein LTR17_011965 [Elasticomyces elasticus]